MFVKTYVLARMKAVSFAQKIESSVYNKQNKKLMDRSLNLSAQQGLTQSLGDFLNVFRTRSFYTQTLRGVALCHLFLSYFVVDIVLWNNHHHDGKINDFKAHTTAILRVWSVREERWTKDRESRE